MTKRIVGLLIAVVFLVGVLAISQFDHEPLKVSGFVEADEIRVGSRVGGRVLKVHVVEGQRVRKGMPLLELEPFDLLERRAEAQARLNQQQAQFEKLALPRNLWVKRVLIFGGVHVFGVPIHGNLALLLILSMLFLVCGLGLGLLVSTVSRTQLQAIQFAFLIMLPSVLLSGFMFPRSQMPTPIYLVTFAIPVTYFLEILRGIVLRGADLRDLWPHVVGMIVCVVVIFGLSLSRFRKQLG